MGRVLGVDLGDARIGVAVSDPLRLTATPLDPLPSTGPRKDLARLERLVREWAVQIVVVGLPLHLDGRAGERARQAQQFAAELRRRNPKLDVVLWDESLTTVAADEILGRQRVDPKERKARVDGIAAALILQGWLQDPRPKRDT